MDIHVNDLIFEEGFKDVILKDVSFRDLDQEFIFVRSVKSFDTDVCNVLYYCFVKPYEGQVFRRIGETDERDHKIYVDEDMTEIDDVPYCQLENETISKIIENGDLLSNQLLVDIPFDYYESNKELSDLMGTRQVKWIDDIRKKGNPDWVEIGYEGENLELKLLKCEDGGILAENGDRKFFIDQELKIQEK